MSFFEELKRRNVFRAGIAYVVVAWLALQVADVVLPVIKAPDWVFQVLLLLLVICFPLVLVIAWAFELTAEGFKRESEVDHAESAPPITGRQLDFAIIGLLALALGYFAFDKFVVSPQRDAELVESTRQAVATETAEQNTDKSIAVLPFRDMSPPEDEQEYFSDGLSEELLNLLARIPALRVIARTSSFSYKGKDKKIADISRELNVDHVLDGSVRKSGTRVRITAQLVRADDSSNLWAGNYEATLDDIFAVQDEIASAVVDELKIRLLGDIPTAQQANPEAYALYLQARELSRQSTEQGHARAIELYGQALTIAPDYPAAWTGLSDSHIFLAERSLRPIEETFGKAREAADTALGHDPDFAPAHASLGRIAMVHDSNLAAAATHLQRALELDPTNTEIIRQSATFTANINRLDEAIVLLEYAVARDPVSSAVHANLGLNYYAAGRLEEATASYETALSLSPNAVGLNSWLGTVFLEKGEPQAALEAMEKEPSEPWRLLGLVIALHALGQTMQSDEALSKMIDDYGEEWPFNIAYALAYRGETGRAFEWLQKAKAYNDPGLSEIVSTPEFDNIRSDPRWQAFIEDIGKSEQQLAAIEFTVTRPE